MIVKELLEEIEVFEQSTRPKRSALQFEKEKLENDAIEFFLNLWDMKKQLEEGKSNIIKMEENLVKKQQFFLKCGNIISKFECLH